MDKHNGSEVERYYRLFDGLLRYFFYARLDSGEFFFVCQRIAGVLGHSPEEFLARWREFLGDDSNNSMVLSRFQPGYPCAKDEPYEIEFFHKDGRRVWLKGYESPVYDGAGKRLRVDGIFVDIVEEKRLERQLRLSETRFREMSQSSPVGIFQVDPNDLYVYVNPAWETIAERSLIETLGTPWWRMIYPEDQERVFLNWAEAEKNGNEFYAECRMTKPDGKIKWIQINTRFLYNDEGKITFGTLLDISERKEAQEKREQLIQELLDLKKRLEEAARTDPLTGLPNRRDFEEKVAYEIKRFERHGKPPFGLVIGDIDHFKKINDTYGHDGGDQALKQAANLMKTTLRKQDMVFRWGGEEFLILLPETDLKGAETLSEKVRAKFESEDFLYNRQKIPVTMSFGVALYFGDCPNVDHCLKQADDRLYVAKRTGRNKVVSKGEATP